MKQVWVKLFNSESLGDGGGKVEDNDNNWYEKGTNGDVARSKRVKNNPNTF